MRIRSFTVPFSKVLPEDAHELEFGPDDYMVVRPIFGLSAESLTEYLERMQKATTEAEGDALYADVVKETVLEWHLSDGENDIPLPATRKAARKLPGALAGALFDFLTSYRGDSENPTTRG